MTGASTERFKWPYLSVSPDDARLLGEPVEAHALPGKAFVPTVRELVRVVAS